MNRPHSVVILLVGLLLTQFGCDTGLQPLNNMDDPSSYRPSGFSGVIRFKNWPTPAHADSVAELRLVAFTTFPSDSAAIYIALLTGRAVVYPPIGTTGFRKYVDSIHYTWTKEGTTLQIAKYDYIVLAQRYGTNFFTDWQPAGVYTTHPGTFEPAPVRVLLHRVLQNVDIDVDFQNPPPKPWR